MRARRPVKALCANCDRDGNCLLDIYGHVTEKMQQESANRMEQFIKAVNI